MCCACCKPSYTSDTHVCPLGAPTDLTRFIFFNLLFCLISFLTTHRYFSVFFHRLPHNCVIFHYQRRCLPSSTCLEAPRYHRLLSSYLQRRRRSPPCRRSSVHGSSVLSAPSFLSCNSFLFFFFFFVFSVASAAAEAGLAGRLPRAQQLNGPSITIMKIKSSSSRLLLEHQMKKKTPQIWQGFFLDSAQLKETRKRLHHSFKKDPCLYKLYKATTRNHTNKEQGPINYVET